MVLLAKRVKEKREPVKMASTSSADEKRRIRSKRSAASSLVSIPEFPVKTRLPASPPPRTLSLRIRRADANIQEPGRTRPMSRAHNLLRLALAAVWSSPQRPLVARADRIHRIPKLRGDPRVGRIFQHPHPLTFLDLPRNLASELKVVAFVINRPGFVGLHVDTLISRGNELFQTQRSLSGQNADIGHANHGQPVPTFGAQRATGSRRAYSVRRFARTQISRKTSIRDNRRRLRGHTFIVIGEGS